MSDPMTNIEIEDVLSSIRRLVSEDLRPAARRFDAAGTGKLVLTPAFRVQPDNAPPQVSAEASADASAESMAEPAAGTRPQDVPQAEASGLEWRVAELEVAVAARSDEFEPDGSEVTDKPAEDWDALLDAALRAGSDANEAWSVDGWDESDAQEASDQAPEAERAESDDDQDANGNWQEVTGVEGEDEAAVQFTSTRRQAGPDETSAAADEEPRDMGGDTTKAATDQNEDQGADAMEWRDDASDSATPQDEMWNQSGPAAAAGEDEAEEIGVFDDAEDFLDEEMLREMVRDIVRQELQGSLGERITRNVRKLVRAEINRAMSVRDLD